MPKTAYNKIIDQIGKLILSGVGEQRIVIDFGVNKPPNRGDKFAKKDIFDMMVEKGIAASRDLAIRLCAEKYPANTEDGKWRELAKWVLEYEQEELRYRLPNG